MRETKFKSGLIDILQPSFRVYRIENKLESGMPDLLISRVKYFKPHVWIEVKLKGDWLHSNQKRWIARARYEIILIAQRLEDRVWFFKRDEDGIWEVIHEDIWPGTKEKDILELIMEQ